MGSTARSTSSLKSGIPSPVGVVAGLDGVEHLLDEARTQPVFRVHHRVGW